MYMTVTEDLKSCISPVFDNNNNKSKNRILGKPRKSGSKTGPHLNRILAMLLKSGFNTTFEYNRILGIILKSGYEEVLIQIQNRILGNILKSGYFDAQIENQLFQYISNPGFKRQLWKKTFIQFLQKY